MKFSRYAQKALSGAARLPILFYRYCISPLLPPACRFVPTCSEYALEAIDTHGVARGGILTLWRLLRCHPLSRGGYDPVPKAFTLSSLCHPGRQNGRSPARSR